MRLSTKGSYPTTRQSRTARHINSRVRARRRLSRSGRWRVNESNRTPRRGSGDVGSSAFHPPGLRAACEEWQPPDQRQNSSNRSATAGEQRQPLISRTRTRPRRRSSDVYPTRSATSILGRRPTRVSQDTRIAAQRAHMLRQDDCDVTPHPLRGPCSSRRSSPDRCSQNGTLSDVRIFG